MCYQLIPKLLSFFLILLFSFVHSFVRVFSVSFAESISRVRAAFGSIQKLTPVNVHLYGKWILHNSYRNFSRMIIIWLIRDWLSLSRHYTCSTILISWCFSFLFPLANSSICNKAFTQLANLQRHNLVHNGKTTSYDTSNWISLDCPLSLFFPFCFKNRSQTIQMPNMPKGIQSTC